MIIESRKPSHYDLETEPLEVIQAWDLNFCLGNVVKYVARAGKKKGETKESDLKKAMDYLHFELKKLEKEKQ